MSPSQSMFDLSFWKVNRLLHQEILRSSRRTQDMGQVLEGMSPFTYEHWMPDEEPTFYIPVSHPLSPRQMLVLAEAGIRPGEPFILTNDGRLSRPASKKMALRGWYDCFTIKKGSTNLYEEEEGKFSLEFQYFAPHTVEIEVRLSVKDASDGTSIRSERYAAKWGPFALAPTMPVEAGNDVPTGQRGTPTLPSGYTKWTSKRYNLQPSNAMALVPVVQLPTVTKEGAVTPSLYDIMLIVTPALPNPPANRRSPRQQALPSGLNGSTALSPRQIELTSQQRAGTTKYHKISPVPSDDPAESGSAIVNSNSAAEDRTLGASYGTTITTTRTASSRGGTRTNAADSQKVTHRVQTVTVRGESGNISTSSADANNSVVDPSQWVQSQAFFFRVNYESYQNRHTLAGAQSNVGGSGSSGGERAMNRQIFMRSRAVRLDCALQLYQIEGRVYNRLALYGMDGYRFPALPVRVAADEGSGGGSAGGGGGGNDSGANSSGGNGSVYRPVSRVVAPTAVLDAPSTTTTSTSPTPAQLLQQNQVPADAAECLICMSNPQTTLMFPCRHLCLCDECAATMATRTNASANHTNSQNNVQEKKCPVCRKPVIVMFQLKIV